MSDVAHERGAISVASHDAPFVLDSGAVLSHAEIAFETYGVLNEHRDNAILVCHALTGSAHVAGRRADGTTGWWDALVGAGRAIDTRKWFVICTNVLGGCYGSTGPT
jgi:homoserine O-acetyltransferase